MKPEKVYNEKQLKVIGMGFDFMTALDYNAFENAEDYIFFLRELQKMIRELIAKYE